MGAKKSNEVKKSQEIDVKYKWDLQQLYSDDLEWEGDFNKLSRELQDLAAYKGTISGNAAKTLEFVKIQLAYIKSMERLAQYAHLAHAQDTRNQQYLEATMRIEWLFSQYGETVAYFMPEYFSSDKDAMKTNLVALPEFSEYAKYFDDMERYRGHVLSEQEEILLAKAGEALDAVGNAYSLFTNADMVFPKMKLGKKKLELTEANYGMYIRSSDRETRKTAFTTLFSTYAGYKHTLAQMLNGNAKSAYFSSSARNFDSTIASSLFGDDVPIDFYETVIQKIHEILPVNHRYVAMKKNLLALDELYPYDLYAPLLKEEKNKTLDYEIAYETVVKGLSVLGDGYIELLNAAKEKRWIDVYPAAGKRSGGFCSSAYGYHPYVLLNFNGTFNECLTIAHEMGHAMHSWYSDNALPFHYAGYSIMSAEVASITNELIVLRYLMRQTDKKKELLTLMNHFLEGFRTTVFRQALFAEFEKETHAYVNAGSALTSDWLAKLWRGLNEAYYGPDLAYDELLDIEWARIPHFYTPFYVYKYVVGFVCAVVISQKIDEGDENVRLKYLAFLKSGGIDYPLNLLEDLGISLRDGEAFVAAGKVFEEFVERFEKETKGEK